MAIPQAVVATGNGGAERSVVAVSFWATRGSGAAADIVILSAGGLASGKASPFAIRAPAPPPPILLSVFSHPADYAPPPTTFVPMLPQANGTLLSERDHPSGGAVWQSICI